MKSLDAQLLARFLERATDQLQGEWLLVGGTLLPAVGLHVRSTVDIDLVGLGAKEASQTLELMELAESLGLSVESINQAAAFFVNKVGYKKNDLLRLKKGKSATLYRPSYSLYLKLKLPRMTESDLTDLQHYYLYCVCQKDPLDADLLLNILTAHLKKEKIPEKIARIRLLEQALISR